MYIKNNGKVSNKVTYYILGIDLEGKKDILSIIMEKNKSFKFWITFVDKLRSRAVEDIFTMFINHSKGFLNYLVQYQIKNTLRYINYQLCSTTKEHL